ncbi:hypothetical protein BC835DRAFT_93151 [Cytidiella melzeri]|nr:hypothetical protein BC835DRAFT_93151 [Cytidiella melzeri]
MPPATFDVQPGLAADAFQYVCNCFEWLAAGSGMLESQRSIVQELDLEKFAQRAERLLWTIRCVQNRSAPVNRLPPELLGVIFEHLMDLQVPAHPSNELMEYQWPVVQSVCRYWRDTAVHTPLLWSYVRIRNPHAKQAQPGLASTILTRSGVVPLTIHIRSQGLNDVVREPCDEHLRDQLKANSWRIYELHTEFAEPIVLDSCLQDASQLERMIINDDTGCLKSSVYGHWRIPKLRTLVAINFTGWRDRGGFRTLRHLILENQPQYAGFETNFCPVRRFLCNRRTCLEETRATRRACKSLPIPSVCAAL